ncbi:uncharacterized protein [Aegilops tauschii subsp. strangulata]|uniref:uncharacterized protein isoform X1 n=1 Tax=Aegilops tauschii subsp. strangulata TaxID=200361 RepID=UPI00098B531D|nr:uncharacterized protein LOC109740379 [Aegilops tauschii subsp. strangulata]
MQRISDTTTLPFAIHYLRSQIMEELDTSHLTERLLQGWSGLDDAEVVIFVGPVTAYAYSFNFSLLLLKGIGTFPARKRNRTVLLPKDKSKNNKNPAPTMNRRSKQNKQTKSCRPSRKGCTVEEQQTCKSDCNSCHGGWFERREAEQRQTAHSVMHVCGFVSSYYCVALFYCNK